MGWTPPQVGECSLWEFMAAVDGYGRAQGWKPTAAGGDLSDETLAEMGIEGFV